MNIKELAKHIQDNYSEEEIEKFINVASEELEQTKGKFKEAAALCQEGGRLEKEGKTLQAIMLYESLIEANFDGSYPYDRLAILYKKLKRPDDVIRVLEKAVYVFENVVYKERADRIKKLNTYREKLEKAKS